jgi:hypothetical protein
MVRSRRALTALAAITVDENDAAGPVGRCRRRTVAGLAAIGWILAVILTPGRTKAEGDG